MNPLEKKFEIIFLNPASLKEYSQNAKIHSQEQIQEIARQIAAFGFDQPIVVDKDQTIIKGHGRTKAALQLGMAQVPVIIQDLSEYEAMAARLGDNKVAEAPWDPEKLKFELGTLQRVGFDTKLTGIGDSMLGGITNPETSETMFGEKAHESVAERKEDYDQSDVRQIILVTDPEGFNEIMGSFSKLQEEFQVETNIEVIEKLVEYYETHRDSKRY